MDILWIPLSYPSKGFVDQDDAFKAKLTAYYEICYRNCVEWFGEPEDAGSKVFVRYDRAPVFQKLWFGNYYLITLSAQRLSWEPIVGMLADAVFRRVTLRKPAISEQSWIRELIVILTRDKMLRIIGFDMYADHVMDLYKEQKQCVPLQNVVSFKEKRFGQSSYPSDFFPELAEIGQWLLTLLDWPTLCRLSRSASVGAWLASLDPIIQSAIQERLPLSIY